MIVLPSLSRSREATRRSSCANNLKQMGIVMKMYSNESRGSKFPPLSKKSNDWMADMDSLYPEYLTDLQILVCPISPNRHPDTFRLVQNTEHPGAVVGEMHPDCVTGRFYNYTGYWLSGDEPALALYLAYHAHGRDALPDQDLKLPMPRWENSDWQPVGSGGVLLWDRLAPGPVTTPHLQGGANVLSMDGSVQFVPYSPLNSSRKFPVTEMTTWTFSVDVPRVSRDCL
jgi:hypothetical protein